MTPFDAELPVDLPPPEEVRPAVNCWRCELSYDLQLPICPHCRARNHWCEVRPKAVAGSPIQAVLVFYTLLLVTSVIYAAVFWSQSKTAVPDDDTILFGVVSGIDALIVLAAMAYCGAIRALPPLRAGRVAAVWLAAIPAFAALLALNYGYFKLLRDYINADWLVIEATPLTTANVILMCLMPALFEELFFRYLALGTFWRVVGLRGAVLISSAMFALAHLYNPLGLPYLFVCGCVLGYARALGGGMLLPVILHFAHNYIVLFVEAFA